MLDTGKAQPRLTTQMMVSQFLLIHMNSKVKGLRMQNIETQNLLYESSDCAGGVFSLD